MPNAELVIPRRFNGPPNSGNGGYTAGRVAAFLPTASVVRVTVRAPVPLDTRLAVTIGDGVIGDGVRVHDGDRLIAEAVEVDEAELGLAVPPVSEAEARAAMTRFDGLADHPFPTCFACGTARADGLRLFAGSLAHAQPADPSAVDRTRTAAVFIVRPDLARVTTESGPSAGLGAEIGAEIVWAVLDCPGGWTLGLPGRPAVLGRITARIRDVPAVGETVVAVAQLDVRDGRKAFTRTCAYGADGRELGRAASVWIEVDRT